MPPTSDDRVNIILPAADRDLASRIAAALGADPERGRSTAIRYSLRVAAEKLGLSATYEAPARPRKKRR